MDVLKLIPMLSALALVLLNGAARAQVTYFESPPTVEQLQAALRKQQPTDVVPGSPRIRARGVVPADSIDESRPGPATGESWPAIAIPVYFVAGTARISKNSLQFIDAIAELLASDTSLRLVVEGHTDATGDARHNMMLSWERAFTVFKTLVQRYGVDPTRLTLIGKGDTDPMPGTDPTAEVNRRVQFRPFG